MSDPLTLDDLHKLVALAREANGHKDCWLVFDWPAALEAVCEIAIGKDECIRMLADRLAICSALLTRAAERLGWDTEEVRELVAELRESLKESSNGACNEQRQE